MDLDSSARGPATMAAQGTRQWTTFRADGFAADVCGVVYSSDNPPCCGVPLGGLGTGCVDVDCRGVWGWSTLFHPKGRHPLGYPWSPPRKHPRIHPILGLASDGGVTVLATDAVMRGGEIEWCTEPEGNPGVGRVTPTRLACPSIERVSAVREIRYWGHYPVADLDYRIEGPLAVRARFWSPFLPGDAAASNMPAAVVEVHVTHRGADCAPLTLAISFPGPDPEEAGGPVVSRELISTGVHGVHVRTPGVGYVLGVLDGTPARFGASLLADPRAWSRIANALPAADGEAGASSAVDLVLAPGEERVVRFVLAWHAPTFRGQTRTWEGRAKPTEGPGQRTEWIGTEPVGTAHTYTVMYAARYRDAADVAAAVARDHGVLLRRVLAWQAAVYHRADLPVWLRESLVNNLALIAEDSIWVKPGPPLGDWAATTGGFAMTESPRACPTTGNMPCDWYGTLPILYFFPDHMRALLRAYRAYQHPDGEIPFALGAIDMPDLATPGYYWQVSLNGFCYTDMVDRLWIATGDDGVLREFYDSVKAATTYTMELSRDPGRAVRMPDVGGMEWWEWGEWSGWTIHAGALRLAGLAMAERMATAMGDGVFAESCRRWRADGSRVLEELLWTGEYYLNYHDPDTGRTSDDVMAYQLDAAWVTRWHGLPDVLPRERVLRALDTIERCNIPLTPDIGAANFARPDGKPLEASSPVAYYGAYAMFCAEVIILASTFIGAGRRDLGLDMARKHWANLVLRQGHPWDLPNMVHGHNGKRHFGTDYYQAMMLWALPGVLGAGSLRDATRAGSLVAGVLEAAAPGSAT